MRAFVLMVLVLNVGFFTWQYLADNQWGLEESAGLELKALPEKAPVPSLVLVSEEPAIVIDVIPVQPLAVAESSLAEARLEGLESEESVLEEAALTGSEAEQAPVEMATAVGSEPAASPAVAEVVAEVEPPALIAICYKAGPFKQRSQPQELEAMAVQYGFDAAITARAGESLLGEWIYLTEYGSLQAARDDVSALKGQGIKDVGIARLANGDLIISLGIFGKQNTLKRRLAELKALGYVNYQTKKRYRKTEEFWLVLSGFEGDQQRILADELGVALADRFPAAQLAPVGCR
jgi:hypothetical protein